MDDTFTTRLHALLAANPRICNNGCAVAAKQTKPYQPSPEEVNRIYLLTLFIMQHLPDPPTGRGGWLRVGSYGMKHCFEGLPWKDAYVSNTEGMVAMMMCGYTPKWSKDPQSPNCVFSVRAKAWRNMSSPY